MDREVNQREAWVFLGGAILVCHYCAVAVFCVLLSSMPLPRYLPPQPSVYSHVWDGVGGMIVINDKNITITRAEWWAVGSEVEAGVYRVVWYDGVGQRGGTGIYWFGYDGTILTGKYYPDWQRNGLYIKENYLLKK